MPRPVHFEIHTGDPERAIAFYSSVFGWSFAEWGPGEPPYWLIKTGEEGAGIDGGLIRRMGPPPDKGQPVNAYVCTVDVPDLDRYVAAAKAAGAEVALEKMAVPGVGWLAYVADPEGNILGMMQADPKAA